MLKLTEKRFTGYFRQQAETGMGYWIATVFLKNGGVFPQAVIVGGVITHVRGLEAIPFTEREIDRCEVTHDKWDFS